MTNLIFDLPNMLYRSMFVISGFGTSRYTFDSQKEVDELMRKLSMDICYIIRLTNPSRVFVTLDSKSWRKDIPIEENEGYKGQREKAKHINWDHVFETFKEFCEILENNGMIVTKIEKAEADDIMAMYAYELLFQHDENVIIVSGDEDVRQLVKFWPYEPGKMKFSTVFNPFMQGKNASRKLYVPEHFMEWLNKEDEADIWNMSSTIDQDKDDFRRIVNTEKVKVEEVNGNMIAMRKVFCGDDGDNIPAMYTWIDDKKKEVRITNGKFEKIYEGLQRTPGEAVDDVTLMERKDEVFDLICKVCKSTPAFNITDRLLRQLKLVVLSPRGYFPESILREFDKIKKEELAKQRPMLSGINMNSMLQGTRYVRPSAGGTGVGTESSIFKELDKLSNKQLF
jgi:5'-3' exonuclease